MQGALNALKEFLLFAKREGIVGHRLEPHVKIPRSERKAVSKAVSKSGARPMTATGHAGLHKELQGLKGRRGDVADAIGKAAADRDFSENAPLDAAREVQGKMEARIRELEETLRRAVIMEQGNGARLSGVQVGSKVVLREIASGKESHYILVASSEADPVVGKLSVDSPVGKALMGRNPGDEVDVTAPRGVFRYRIASLGQ